MCVMCLYGKISFERRMNEIYFECVRTKHKTVINLAFENVCDMRVIHERANKQLWQGFVQVAK